MDRNSENFWLKVGSDLKPHHLLCLLVWICASSFNVWRDWDCAVFRCSHGCIEVDCTISTLRKQNPRTSPLLCVHCFEWKPKLLPQKMSSWMRFRLMLESTSVSRALICRALNAYAEVFQWECVNLFDGVWIRFDSSSGIRRMWWPINTTLLKLTMKGTWLRLMITFTIKRMRMMSGLMLKVTASLGSSFLRGHL